MSLDALGQQLDRLASEEKRVTFWLRDDDAVYPTNALQRLLSLTQSHGVPLTLAVIPEETGRDLANLLSRHSDVRVCVHGWSHRSYSQPPAKKQELGLDRPLGMVLGELQAGFDKLQLLFDDQFEPMLVPPWNRISAEVVEALPPIGFESLSVFGREKTTVLPMLNTHVDLMDWRGTGGGKTTDVLASELLDWLCDDNPVKAIGVLAHHLVHDDNAWTFLEQFLALSAEHPACNWAGARDILA